MTVILPLLAFIAVVFATPPAAEAVDPGDYDVPVSTAQQVRLGGTYAYASTGSYTETNNGSAWLRYHRYYNSLPYAWDLNFRGVGATRRTYEDKQKGSYEFVAFPGIRKYFDPAGDLFYSGELSVRGNSDFDRPGIDVTPGVGSGRFIRVTPLAQAVRIQEFLIEEGVIKGPLPDETLIELAQVIERRDEFEARYGDRYEVKWLKEMERIVLESGQFAHAGLGAVGSLRVYEVLFEERVNERYTGWDVRAGLPFQVVTTDTSIDRRDPGLSLRFRWSRPVGWVSQVDVSAEYISPFNSDFGVKDFTISSNVNYLYEVSNRVDFVISNDLSLRVWQQKWKRMVWRDDEYKEIEEGETESTAVEQIRAGFLFFIENQVNLNVTGSLTKPEGSDASLGLNMAVEYRLR